LGRHLLKMLLFILIGAAAIAPSDSFGDEMNPRRNSPRNFIGFRIGAWTTTTTEVLDGVSDDESQLPERLIYGEFFYSHRMNPYLNLELSAGVFSPHDLVTYPTAEYSLVGSATVTPIFLSVQLFPVRRILNLPIDPYLQIGAGLVMGSQSVVDSYYGDVYDYSHAEKLTYCIGAGINWPVADQIALTSNFKYTPVKFGKPLMEFKDYSGWQISIGAGYTFENK
jgi:hypothetical protein